MKWMLKQKQAQYGSNPKPATKAQLELKCSFHKYFSAAPMQRKQNHTCWVSHQISGVKVLCKLVS